MRFEYTLTVDSGLKSFWINKAIRNLFMAMGGVVGGLLYMIFLLVK